MTQASSSSSPSSSSQPAPSPFAYTLQPPVYEYEYDSAWPSPSPPEITTAHDSFDYFFPQLQPRVTPTSERSGFSLSPVTPPPVSSPPADWHSPEHLDHHYNLEALHYASGDTTNLWQQSSLSEEVKRLSPRRPDFPGSDRDDAVDQTPSSSSYIMQQPTYQQDQYSSTSLQPTGYPSMASIYPTGLGSNFPDFNAYNPHYPAQPYATPFPTSEPATDPWQRNDLGHVGPQEFAQALLAYRHIQAAIPHIRPADHQGPSASGQPYRSIVDCANTAADYLSGRLQVAPAAGAMRAAASRPSGGAPEPKRARASNGDKDRPATYCRGCGATETPEWRRGPLGPRTLCNACGLVHMKMLRKKKKAEEKAAQAAASAKG
ncbi:hypothetical protein Q8F55_008116 [Vanrija albida]|uniref:GATA-type domain-containing protein n=1 Tax=Vanrija albida TaxID=181172 RepID=A0ABR3PWB0_9TREE